MWQWIVFDVGGVLINEDVFLQWRYNEISLYLRKLGYNVSSDELIQSMKEIRMNSDGKKVFEKILIKACNNNSNHFQEVFCYYNQKLLPQRDKLWLPYDDVLPVLHYLERKYKLAIAANQPRNTRTLLDMWDYSRYFKTIILSDEIGLEKPDANFFNFTLNELGASNYNCLYIGDRIDNDVEPAKRLGMGTIRVQRGIEHESKESCNYWNTPLITIKGLHELLELL